MRKCGDHQSSRGLTLIEVIAALAILASLLVAVVEAKGRFVHQWQGANQRLLAAQAADKLLTQWTSQPSASSSSKPSPKTKHAPIQHTIPVPASGMLSHHLRWRTEALDSPILTSLHARRVRLEILSDTGITAGQVLAKVDVVAPLPKARRKGGHD